MKKFICFSITLILLISSLSMAAYAIPVKIGPYSGNAALCFPEDAPEFIDNSGVPVKFYSNPFGTYHFRDMLSETQKAVYDCILDNQAGLLTDGEFQLVFPVTDEDMSLSVEAALCAIMDDYPEYFWIGGYGWSGGYVQNSTYYLDFHFTLKTSDYADWDVLRQSYYSMLDCVENVTISGGTRYDKVKIIHDYICSITTYTSTAMAHQPTGVFLNGMAVCEGYAEAFKLLCDRENIPCVIVVGTGNGGAHEWNYVQMDDGKWYGMDVTWDDQGANIYYDYFLVGSGSYTSGSFGSRLFGNGTDSNGDHINSGTHFQNPKYALTYPTLSTNSYSLLVPFKNATAVYDTQRGFMFLTKNAVAAQQLFCTYSGYSSYAPSNNKASLSGTTTGGTLTVTSPVSKTYKLVRWGDVNADNSVNQSDVALVNAYIAGDASVVNMLNNDSAKFNAADMNQDGVIDAFDLFYTDLYVNTDRRVNN